MKLAENKGKRSDLPERILLLSYTVSVKHHPLILNQVDDDKIWSHWGFPDGTSGKQFTCQQRRCKRHGFDPWVGKIPWRRARQPISVFFFFVWRIPWTEETGGIQFMGSHRVRHNWSNLAHTMKVKVKSLSCVRLFATPWTVAYQDPRSMGFSRQEYWSGLPFPSPGDLPDPGIEPGSSALQADASPSEPPGKSAHTIVTEYQHSAFFWRKFLSLNEPSLGKVHRITSNFNL